MDLIDLKPKLSGGGRAGGGSGFYHLSFRSGSRSGGVCARSAHAYVTRQDEYDDPDRDAVVYTESGHMPAWVDDASAAYWDAADLFERANGRLYVSADFALPRDLSQEDQIELAREFARELTDGERLPYTLAIHAGRDESGHEHNPHAHLMFSERRNDGVDRPREAWFRRANADHPERGGAPKSRTFHGRAWVDRARERWAEATNRMLERRGHTERVDHRSYERQGVDRQPGEHYGPAAAHLVGRGEDHDRIYRAGDVADSQRALTELDKEIGRLEAAKETILRDGLADDRQPERRDYSHSFGGGTRGDQSRER
jgi:hypothetical protein